MHFRSDEIQPFYEARQSLSKTIDEIERSNGQIVIAKHGKPVAALLSAASLYRYREVDRLMAQLVDVLLRSPVDAQTAQIVEQVQALTSSAEHSAYE